MDPSAPTIGPGDETAPTTDSTASSTTDSTTDSTGVSAAVATTSGRIAVDDDRILGGVAGFIARRLEVDPLWVRIGFVLLALAGGIGLVLYAGLWLVLTADRSTSWRWPRVAGGAIVVIGIPLLLNAQAGRFVTGPVAVVLLLSGLALALWRPPTALGGSSGEGAAIDDRPPSSLAPPTPAPAIMSPSTSTAFGGPGADRREWRRPRLTPRESSVLGRATLGLAIAIAATGALIDEANGGRLHPEQWLGIAAIVCGLGLLVGTLRGHGRWLIVPAVVFAGAGYASGTSSRLGIDASDTFGERRVSIGEQQPGGLRTAHSAFGSVDIYVEGVPAEPVVVDARVGIGDIAIWVSDRPQDQVRVEVRSRVDDGAVDLNGGRQREDEPVRLGPEGRPDVVVTAWVGRGDVTIETFLRDVPPAVPVFEPALPQLGAPLAPIADGVATTADGWIVLADGAAVLGPDDALFVGDQYDRGDGVTAIETPFGEFLLLPRSLLVTPFGQVIDLQAIRSELAGTAPDTSVAVDGADPTTTIDPPATTVQVVPSASIGG